MTLTPDTPSDTQLSRIELDAYGNGNRRPLASEVTMKAKTLKRRN